MSSKMGRLEGRIKVASAWTATVGAGTATVAAGTYYLSSVDSTAADFLQTVADAFATAASTTCSITASLGENGTGIVTITFGSAKAIAWISTDLRDVLGFDDDSASATVHTSVGSARSVWLPSCHYRAPEIPSDTFKGLPYTDTRMVMNQAGYSWHVSGQTHYQLPIEWPAVTAEKTRITRESTNSQSFERFWRDHIFGSATWGRPGGPVRLYPDASSDSAYVEYRVMEPLGSFEPQPLLPDLPTGPHRVAMRLLAIGDDPSTSADRLTISVSALTSGTNTTDATSFATASVSPGSNRAIYLGVLASSSAGDTTPTATGNGLTWVAEDSVVVTASNNRRLTVFRAMGASPSAGAITISWGATTQLSAAWIVVECTNANTSGTNASGATRQSVTNTVATGTSLTGTLAALDHANNVHLCFLGNDVGSVTPDADFAELADVGVAGALIRIQASWATNETACTNTFSSGNAGCISLEVKSGT